MLRFVPPAGFPINVRQIWRALKSSRATRIWPDHNLAALAPQMGVRYVNGVSSGRAALAIVLKSLHRLKPDRSIVALPAYTCFTVAASIVRAGLKIYPVDIDAEKSDFDFSQLEAVPAEKLLCIMTANLFGIVNDLARTREIARGKGAFFVDDAAQAMGATRNGYSSGTFGDVGIYSLGRGKALAAMEGGLVLTDSEEISSAVRSELKQVPEAARAHESWMFFQLLAYAILLNPRLYWIPNSLPFLKLGTTEFDPNFHSFGLPKLAYGLLTELVGSLADVNTTRRRNAAAIAKALEGVGKFSTPGPARNSLPTYIRFPVIARDQATRDMAVTQLRAAGIGAGPFYPSAICDIPGIDAYMARSDFHQPQAEDLARRLFTLPTHPLVTQADIQRMISILNGI